jgi:hypothetical protein
MARIETLEALRELIPAPAPHASAKLRDRLCDQGIAFIRECPRPTTRNCERSAPYASPSARTAASTPSRRGRMSSARCAWVGM